MTHSLRVLTALVIGVLALPAAAENAPAPGPAASHAPIAVPLKIAEPGFVTLVIEDSDGRRIRNLGTTATESGLASFRWDGRDDAGRALPGGVYWARAEANGTRTVARLVLVR